MTLLKLKIISHYITRKKNKKIDFKIIVIQLMYRCLLRQMMINSYQANHANDIAKLQCTFTHSLCP